MRRPGRPVILLINAPSTRAIFKEDRCQIDANDVVARFFRPPISLMLLAGVAESAGFDARVIDCPAHGYTFRTLNEIMVREQPAYVIINTSEQTAREDFLSLRMAKRLGAITIVFGYYATVLRGQFLVKHGAVDLLLTREPEDTLADLLSGKPLPGTPGLVYRDGGGNVVENPDRPFIKDLDKLPFSSHHLVDFTRYRYPLSGKPFTVVQVSRGCPFACHFCLAKFMNGTAFRTRSVKVVLDEIEHVVRALGVRTFFLRADTFTLDKTWIHAFCRGIKARGLSIDWFTNSRIDTIPSRLVPMMGAAGCRIIGIGIETGVPSHQARLGKNITLGGVKEKLDLMRRHGILTIVYFLIGQPFDTARTITYNIQYSKIINPTFVEFTPYVDFEVIPLHDAVQRPVLSSRLVRRLGRRGEVAFYGRPGKVLEMMCIVERSLLLNMKRFLVLMRNVATYVRRVFFF